MEAAATPSPRAGARRIDTKPISTQDCQKADWKRHRGDCRLLKAERQINHFERRLHAAKAGFM